VTDERTDGQINRRWYIPRLHTACRAVKRHFCIAWVPVTVKMLIH